MSITMGDPARSDTGVPERMRFYPKQLIHAADLNDEQAYHRQKLREHNRFLHGWGVVCGCDVRAVPSDEHPWRVRIGPGYLLTPQGDAVSIRADVTFNLANCLLASADPCAFARPCPPVSRRTLADDTVYLAIRYTECETRPVHTAPTGCSCSGAACQYTRIRDAYEICCLSALPKTHASVRPDCDEIFKAGITECPSCPDDPWVVLATVRVPRSPRTPIDEVDPLSHRRSLHSTALLKDMVSCLSEGG
ncbi:hypothetical protein [Streptomyces flaveus]|uniref:hypothetical protein n=1 Tax=Streptomyces flaveus TaxID=66370 RepID=UPI00331A9CF9